MKGIAPQKVRRIFWMILLTGFAVGSIGAFLNMTALSATGILVMLASGIFRYAFFRCPYCGRFLDRCTGDHCPYCGKEIDN